MSRRKSKNPKSCPRGKKLVKIGRRKFCAKPSSGKKTRARRGKKGVAGMSTAERKAMMRKACKRTKGAARKKMAGLCDWAKA